MFEVDHNTANRLSAAKGPQYVCNPEGRILGHYVPIKEEVYAEDLDPRISEEELRRRSQEESGRPLSDILAEWERRRSS
jgi:hypothetical protein